MNNIEVVQDSDSFTLLVASIKVQSSAWNSGTSCLLNITLCVCVCVWNRRSQFSYYRCTQDISKHMMPTSKNQLPRLQWQFTFALDNGMNLLSLALDKRERDRHTVQSSDILLCWLSNFHQFQNGKVHKHSGFQKAEYVHIRTFRMQRKCVYFMLSVLRQTFKLQWNCDMAFLNASVICDLRGSLNVISNCYNPTP